MVLCDTNIIIEVFKNNSEIIKVLKGIGQENLSVSVITVQELVYGARNKAELKKIMSGIQSITTYYVNDDISKLSLKLMLDYSLSNRLSIPDSYIASTSLFYKIPLYTLNKKDFKYIPDLVLH